MARFDISKSEIDMTCPHCGHKCKKSLAWIQRPGASCPGCGAKFEASQLRQTTQRINASVKKFEQQIKRLGGKMRF